MNDISLINDKTIGFSGGGMMAEAIVAGLTASGIKSDNISVFDIVESRRLYLREKYNIGIAESNAEIVQFADVIILAVKPNVVPNVLAEVGSTIGSTQLVISNIAGVKIESIEKMLANQTPVIRVMPNTPALIGMGASALSPGKYADATHMSIALHIYSAVGKAIEISEEKLDAVTGLSGSGPAYVYMMIEAMADGGVRMGLPRATALMLAAQTVAGTALMVLDSDDHPAVLKDRVTTPGGTTIEGIAALERNGFRNSIIEAVTAATKRSEELGKK
ncbi:MAG: pyrroline-5-carboxylate reductase [Armatimonadota bacterium]